MSQTKQLTEIQERWLQALESGDYKQGQGKLRSNDDEYCCLGVACAVNGWETWDGRGRLYPEEAEELGLRSRVGAFYEPLYIQPNGDLGRSATEVVVDSLTNLNDDVGWDFETIAAWIRENPSEVFV